MEIKEFNSKYGRLVLIAFSLLFWIVIVWSFIVNGYLETWSLWHFPAKLPPFIDFRLIPSGAETFRTGIDPAISNLNDPRGHIFNYPKIWYIFFYTGITQADTVWICIIMIVLFFATLFTFPGELFSVDALMMLMIVFSPACMLLYERGNVDLIFFVLCGLAIGLVSRFPGWTVTVLSVASFFKFFPFFGVSVFLQKDRSKFFKPFMLTLLLFLIYVALNFDSISASWNLTQRGVFLSYGSFVIFDALHAYIRYYLLQVLPEVQVIELVKILPYLFVFSFASCFFFLGARVDEEYTAHSEKNLIAFRMGCAIYVGTFFLGNNWDYRMAFLIFTIPQLSRWIFTLPSKRRLLTLSVFVLILTSVWYTVILYNYFLITNGAHELRYDIFDELINWILFGGLIYLFVASAPEWFRTFAWFPPRIQSAE